ncbi:MAG: non-ribosomal peptide synthetase [Isosphaeraceae bacterium]|nr:non-ribosomal peptide synthetase [Isosphaeraceae bacterium]
MSIRPEAVEGSISSEFERQADVHGARAALQTPAHRLTYEQVDRAANRVANELLARRGDASEPIPLIVAEPALMLVAALGVLKAGKFYVPVNPHFPPARIRFMLDDVAPALVLCDGVGQTAATAAGEGALNVQLEDLLSGRGAETRPATTPDPHRLAYILYTSGSTGRPKGVPQAHRNVLNNVMRHNGLNIVPEDRVTLLSADGFVGSVSNPYMALLNGASLASYSFRHDGVHGIRDWLAQERITVYYSFPSFFRQIVAAASGLPHRPGLGLRLLYLGGESVFPSDLAAARSLFPGATLAVGLNSTETGLTRLRLIAPDEQLPENVVSVGGPVPDVEVSIVDEDGRRLEDGHDGEIAVASPYTFASYWRQEGSPEYEARTVGRPAGWRVFRTGDRGYIDDRGELVHLGRRDTMVKVRGYRVELSEVESALSAIPEVEEAVVVPDTRTPEAVELVAYVVVGDRHLDGRGLHRALAAVLPEAMIPSVFVLLDALPRTENGKVDRRALPAPSTGRVEAGGGYVPPRNPVEEQVARIWSKELSAARVGVGDNFFELGGHSIMAVRVISTIRKEFGVSVPLRVVFETPTVDALAQQIVRLQVERDARSGRA